MNLDARLLAARDEVANRRAHVAAVIADAKSALLNPVSNFSSANSALTINPSVESANIALDVEPSQEVADSSLQITNDQSSIQTTSPIIETLGPISKHADGTYSATTVDGKVTSGLSEVDAKTFLSYDTENIRAQQADAPADFLGTKTNAIVQTTIDLGAQAASAFTTDPENLKAIKDFGENLKTKVPVNRKEQVAAHTAFKTIAKNSGSWEATKNALANDLGTLISQGIDSVPYMIAFTVGGPVAQTAILTSLAIGKGNQAVEEFTAVNGRRPTADETQRIKIWSAVGTVAEKYGDMAALKAIPGRLAWIKQVEKTAKAATPASILSLAVFKPAAGLAGEGLSGGITSATEQLAAEGKVTDTGAIAFDALAEAAGTPGGIAAMVTASTAVKGVQAGIEEIKKPSFKVRAKASVEAELKDLDSKIESTDPIVLGNLPEYEPKVAELNKINSVIADAEVPIDSTLSEDKGNTENKLFNDLYNEFIADEFSPENAELEANKVIKEETGKLKVRRDALVTELTTAASESDVARYKTQLTDKRTALQDTYADGDFSKKALEEKLAGKVLPDLSGTKIKDEEFNATLKDINTSSTEKAIGILMRLSTRVVSTTQKVALLASRSTLLKKVGNKGIEALDNVLAKVDDSGFFGSIGDTNENLNEARNNPDNTEQDNKSIDAQIAANKLETELSSKDTDKTMKQVHDDVVDGESVRWKGINVLKNEILSLLNSGKDAVIVARRIRTATKQMRTHAENLHLKSVKFSEALALSKKEGRPVRVVTRSDKKVRGSRAVRYEIPKDNTVNSQNENAAFTTIIDENSTRLIDTVTKESAFGAEVLTVTEGHADTSFRKKVIKDQQDKAVQAAQIADLQNVENNLKTELELLNPEDISNPESDIGEIIVGSLVRRKDIDFTQGTPDVSKVVNVGQTSSKPGRVVDIVTDADGTKLVAIEGNENTFIPIDSVEIVKEPDVQSNTSTKGPSPATNSASEEQTTNVRSGTQTNPSTTGVSTKGRTTGRDSTTSPAPKVSPNNSKSETAGTVNETSPIDNLEAIDLGEGDDSVEGFETNEEIALRNEATAAANKSVTSELSKQPGRTKKELVNIDTAELSRQALSLLFPEILNSDGTLKISSKDTLTEGQQNALADLLRVLKLDPDVDLSPESISNTQLVNTLRSLPATKNFLEVTKDTLLPTMSLEQLKEQKTIATGSSTSDTFTQQVASAAENALGILSKTFSQLVKIVQGKNRLDMVGALSIPTAAFETPAHLMRALMGLGISEASASVMAEQYTVYNKRYQAIRFEEKFDNGVLGAKRPLALVHVLGKSKQEDRMLPPQFIFAMSMGVMQFIQKNPSNLVFRSNSQKAAFLYQEYGDVTDNESSELDKLGHSYQDTVDSVGRDIVSYLHVTAFDTETSGYFENLIPALGLAALQIEHGPNNTGLISDIDPNARFGIIKHKWGFIDKFREGRKFNTRVSKEDVARLNEERDRLIAETPKPKSSKFSKVNLYPNIISLRNEIYNLQARLRGAPDTPSITKLLTAAEAELAYRIEIGVPAKEINSTDYKHIKLKTTFDPEGNELPFKLDDKTVTALKETGKAFTVQVRDQYPLQTASEVVITSIKNSYGKVPNYVRKVLGDLQNNPWTKNDAMTSLFILAEIPVVRAELEKIMGVVEIGEFDHESKQLSDRAKNADKINALNEILAAEKAGKLNNFFFTFKLQIQHRILMQGLINPQNSKVTRALLKTNEPAREYNKDNIYLFKQAVAYNFGVKIDKKSLAASEAEFHTIVNNENVQEAVKILAGLSKLENDPQKTNKKGKKLAELLPLIHNEFGGDMSLFAGLVALTNYIPDGVTPKESFSSDVIFEIDGISSGHGMNVAQFPLFGDETDTMHEQVGTQVGKPGDELHHDTSKKDVYETLSVEVNKAAGAYIAEKYYDNRDQDFSKEWYTKINKAMNIEYKPLNDANSRQLVKYPFLIFMYGGGIKSIAEGVGKLITGDMYVKLSAINKRYQDNENSKLEPKAKFKLRNKIKKELTAFANHLDSMGAFRWNENVAGKFTSSEHLIESVTKGTSQKLYFNDSSMIDMTGRALAPRFDKALNGMLGGTGPARKAVIQSGEILYAVFRAHFNKIKAKVLAETNKTSLSKQQIAELIETPELLAVFPQYKGPLISETERAFIDLSKQSIIDEISNEERSEFKFKSHKNRKAGVESAPRESEFVSPGVSTLIRMIINMDSSIMTKVLEKYPNALMLHDAYIGNPEVLQEIAEEYGRLYLEMNSDHNILTTINDQVKKVLEITDETDTEEGTNLRGQINNWLIENANVNKFPKIDRETGEELPPRDLDNLTTGIDRTNDTVIDANEERADFVSEKGGNVRSDQMFLARPDNRVTEEKEPTLETELKKDVDTSVRNRKETFTKTTKEEPKIVEQTGIKSASKTGTPRNVAAQVNRTKNEILIDSAEIERTYNWVSSTGKRTWEIPKVPGVDKLDVDLIQSLEEWKLFIIAHERAHLTEFNTNLKTEASRENHANNQGRLAIFEARAKKEKTPIEKDSDQAADTEMGSLSDLPRDNPKPNEIKDLSAKNVLGLFRRFSGFSTNYYKSAIDMAEHSEVLSRIAGLLSKGMDATTQIRLNVEDIDGITQGRYTPHRDEIRLSLSRQLPVSANGQSPQEVYVHELLHAMTSAALKDNPLLSRRIEQLYNQVKRDIDSHGNKGYELFLEGITNPSVNDITAAKMQYNYLFDNPQKEAQKLHEFLAYAVTNKAMIKYLSNTNIALPVRNKGLLGRLLGIVDLIVDRFQILINQKVYKKPGHPTAFEEMVATVEHLVAVQSKHQSLFKKFQNRTYNAMTEADQKIREFGDRQAAKLIKIYPKNKIELLGSDLATAAALTMSENANIHAARQQMSLSLNKTLRSIANEIGGGSLSNNMIERLLHAKVNISKGRQEAERFTIKWFNGIWKSVDGSSPHEMTVQTREALTDIMLRADISALRKTGMTPKAIMNLLGNNALIEKEQEAILAKLNAKASDRAIQYAEELGHHISTGNNYLSGAGMNALSIARRELNNPTDARVDLLDSYATLSALLSSNRSNSEKVGLVKTLSNNEFAKDPVSNGIIDMMDSHLLYKRNSKEKLFKTNPSQMVKGFIIERVDDLTSIKTGTAADAKQMAKAGFTESYPLSKITDSPGAHDVMYVSRTIPEVPDASGVMSMTNQRNMGTTLTEIFSKDPLFQDSKGNPDFTKIRIEIKKFDAKQKREAKSLKRNHKLKVRPLYDAAENITDYRVMINHADTKRLLRPDMEVQNVFAHMHSTAVDRENTVSSDKLVVELLVHEQEGMAKAHEKLFIDFLNDPAYVDRLRKLPKEVRLYMESLAVDGTFLIREDIVDKVFGFKVWDLSQFKFLQTDSMASVKRIAGITHYLIRQIVGYGKDRIVVAMPKVVFGNMVSNIYQLSMRNIPLTFIASKIIEGISEYKRYQQDTDELTRLSQLRDAKGLPDTSPEAKEIIRLEARIENNKIHMMSAAGLNSLIVEDVNMAASDGYFNRIHKTLKVDQRFQAISAKIPKRVGDVAATMFMTKTSVPYQVSRRAVQLTDFLGRYVMIEHATKVENKSFNTAMHEALTAFVLFDETLTPALEALDAIGATSFISYFLRNQRASRRLVQTNPTGVGLAAAIQAATGVPTLGNVNSAWLTGDIFPNVMQLDDLLDEATNVTGLDLARDAIDSLFN